MIHHVPNVFSQKSLGLGTYTILNIIVSYLYKMQCEDVVFWLNVVKPFYFQVVVAYKRLMRDVVSLLGASSLDAATFADDMFGYEQRLASITPERSELVTRGPLRTTLGDLRMTTQSVGCCSSVGAGLRILLVLWPLRRWKINLFIFHVKTIPMTHSPVYIIYYI